MGRGIWRAAVLAVVLLGCRAQPKALTVDAGEGAPADLAATLGARVRGDTVAFTLRVSNPTSGPVRIEFSSGQRYDFEVGTMVGERVWQWSADQMFSQALESVDLKPGESVEYAAEWAGARAGDYTVRALLTSRNKPVELRTGFVVPSR